MEHTGFLKEALLFAHEKNILIEVRQKQLKTAVGFALKELIANAKHNIIFISTMQELDEIKSLLGTEINKISIVDTISIPSNTTNVFFTNNPADLTKIQIGVEQFLHKSTKPNIILFDSLNTLAIHADKKNVERFFYLFNNKSKLEGNTVIILTAKESTDEGTLETIAQFSDKIFDYSDVFVSAIELKE